MRPELTGSAPGVAGPWPRLDFARLRLAPAAVLPGQPLASRLLVPLLLATPLEWHSDLQGVPVLAIPGIQSGYAGLRGLARMACGGQGAHPSGPHAAATAASRACGRRRLGAPSAHEARRQLSA